MWQQFENIISEHMLQIKFMAITCKLAFGQIPQNSIDDRSPLVHRQFIARNKDVKPIRPAMCVSTRA